MDLQDRFAGARTASQGGLGPEWRERALELEKQLKELKDVHESDKIGEWVIYAIDMKPCLIDACFVLRTRRITCTTCERAFIN